MPSNHPTNVFVEFHALVSHVPGNLNRDELGTPKSAIFGGVRRLRISSQCLKRTWRLSKYFQEPLTGLSLGSRTKKLPDLVNKRLDERKLKLTDEQKLGLNVLLSSIGKSDAGSSEEIEQTAHLLYIGEHEIDAFVEYVRDNLKALEELGQAVNALNTAAQAAKQAADSAEKPEKEAKGKRGKKQTESKEVKEIQEKRDKIFKNVRAGMEELIKKRCAFPPVDVALFGRFVTSSEFEQVDASVQVAHAIGTQKVDIEYDFFTARDDYEQEAAAGHVGETEFASAVFYKYAVCNFGELCRKFVTDPDGQNKELEKNGFTPQNVSAKAMKALAAAIARAVPTGKENCTAPQNPADYFEVVVRRNAPISLANAFIDPVQALGKKDVMLGSIEALRRTSSNYEEAYSEPGDVLARFVLSVRDIGSSGKDSKDETRCKKLTELCDKLEETLLQKNLLTSTVGGKT